MLEAQDRAGRVVAAICAAPTALASHKIGAGRKVTSYPAPAFKESLAGAGVRRISCYLNIVWAGSAIPDNPSMPAMTILINMTDRRRVELYLEHCKASETGG